MARGGVDVIIIEIMYTIRVTCLNNPQTTPPTTTSVEKLSSMKLVPAAKKMGTAAVLYTAPGGTDAEVLAESCDCGWVYMESLRQNGKSWRPQTPSSRRSCTSDWKGVTGGIGGKSGKRRWQENHPRGEFQGECGQELEKAMATHSITLAWKIPWMEEPGKLQSSIIHCLPWLPILHYLISRDNLKLSQQFKHVLKGRCCVIQFPPW